LEILFDMSSQPHVQALRDGEHGKAPSDFILTVPKLRTRPPRLVRDTIRRI